MAPVLKFVFELVQSLIHSQFIFTLFELIQWQTTLLVHLSFPNLQFMTLQLYCCVSYTIRQICLRTPTVPSYF